MGKMYWIFSFFYFFSSTSLFSEQDSWAHVYRKTVSADQDDKTLMFQKRSIPSFSQLLISWNSFRPQEGYLTIFARVRNARTRKWGGWHKMVNWGNETQRSYFGKADFSRYIYVRLETGEEDVADSFAIKVIAEDGASLSVLKNISICTADFQQFKPENITEAITQLPSVYVRGVPKKSQMVLEHSRARHMCSPTSCSMLVSFLSRKQIHPLDFAERVFDPGLDSYGSWHFNMAHAFECCDGSVSFATVRLNSFKQLHRRLKRGIPVAVSVRGFLSGAPKSYDNGHLLLVVGWDAKKQQIICHDPAADCDRKTLKRYDLQSFLPAWERSRRLAYLAEPIIIDS